MSSSMTELESDLVGLDPGDFDIIEWRADALKSCTQSDCLAGLNAIRGCLGQDIPILFTLRRHNEGGFFEGSVSAYADIILSAAQSEAADLVDAELSAGDTCIREVTAAASLGGARVVVSHHNFKHTYNSDVIVSIYEQMFKLNADISKVALMPASFSDCVTAMQAAETIRRNHPDRAVTMISMGRHGLASRIMAQEFGSVITFGALEPEKASAPGQISARDLRTIHRILKKYAVI